MIIINNGKNYKFNHVASACHHGVDNSGHYVT